MDYLKEIAIQIELHSVEGIKRCFSQGVSPNDLFRGKPLIYEIISEYTRGPRFKDCIRAFLDAGLRFEDRVLLSVLCDDAAWLGEELSKDPGSLSKRYTLSAAYTPFHGVSLLHICAEFNHTACADLLLKHGLDVNVRADLDHHGFGGQTPVFHTVNQNGNQSAEMMALLLRHGADVHLTVAGLIWGQGYAWETLIPAVNPVSYAMMGLLPQMHRDEKTTYQIVEALLRHGYGIDYVHHNIPNKYLAR